MIQYKRIDMNQIMNKKVYIWGAGTWGKRCYKALSKKNIVISGYVDNSRDKWNTSIEGIIIYSPNDVIKSNDEKTQIILALEKYESVLKQLENFDISILVYISSNAFSNTNERLQGGIYSIKECEVFGKKDSKDLSEMLNQHKIWIVGDEKYKKDFSYVFDWLSPQELTDWDSIKENMLLIVCAYDADKYESEIRKHNLIYDKNYIYADDLFPLLDIYAMKGIGRIPSVMMYETVYAPMQNQIKCEMPFSNIQISSRFSVHCCCSDWGDDLGNLEQNSLDEIWQSINLKIFRLSIINRTYTFCNLQNCVHLKAIAQGTDERFPKRTVSELYPKRLEIGIDRTCNLYCCSCRPEVQVEKGDKLKRINHVKEEIIKSGWLEKVDRLLLGGQGEVCFASTYKDLMFRDVKNKRKELELRSNGVLMDTKFIDDLRNIYETLSIIISIDAATKETYIKLRRSHDKTAWEKLNRNLNALMELRQMDKVNFFQINMCVQMANYKEIPEFVRWGEQLGVDRVYITPIRNWGTYTEEEFMTVGIYNEDFSLKQEVMEILENPILNSKSVSCVI